MKDSQPSQYQQRAYTSQSRLLPHHLTSGAETGTFLAYPVSSRLMSIVGEALQTTRTHGFVSVWVAPWADQGGVDNGLVEVLIVVRHPRRISWKTSGRILNEEGRKGVNVELLGTTKLSRIFSSPTFTRPKVVVQASRRRERRSYPMCSSSSTFVIRRKGI